MRRVSGIALLVTAAAVGGCPVKPVKPLDPGLGATSKPPVELKSFDPPTRFDESAVMPLEVSTKAAQVLLTGATAVVPIHRTEPTAPPGEQSRLFDIRTGKVRQVVEPTHPLPKTGGTITALPTLISTGGRPTVLAPFLGEVPGEGTAKGRLLIEVVSFDPDTGKVDWRTDIAVQELPGRASDVELAFAGVSDGVGVIRVVDPSTSDRRVDTYAVDLSTHEMLWTVGGFEARAVAAGAVVGLQPGPGKTPDEKSLGLDPRTGKQRWASPRNAITVHVFQAGPTKAIVRGRNDDRAAKDFVEVVDIATGRVATVIEDKPGMPNPFDCHYDEQSIVVCSGTNWVGALDAQTGSWLWSIVEGGDRLVPTVTGAWHGVAYGRTDNGAVVLDAKTGKDRETKPNIAPSVVTNSMAIGPWPGGGVGSAAYPVLG